MVSEKEKGKKESTYNDQNGNATIRGFCTSLFWKAVKELH